MSRGELVPDETMSLVFRPARGADAADGAILDGFPRTGRRPRHSTTRSTRQDARSTGALHRRPVEDLIRRLSSRWLCTANGHVYNHVSSPPTSAAKCDVDGSELTQRDDDKPATVRGGWQAGPAHVRGHRSLPRPRRAHRGRRRPAHATRSPSRCCVANRHDEHLTPIGASRGRPRSSAWPSPALVADVLDRSSARSAGHHHRPLDAHRRGDHLRARRHPVVHRRPGAASPPSATRSASRSTTRSSTASRASGSIRDGEIVSIDAGAIVDGWHGDAARTFIVGEVPERRGSQPWSTDAGPCIAGIAAAVPGNHIGDISAAVEDRREPGYGIVRAFVGPRHRHRDARGAAGPQLPHGLARPRARAGPLPGDRADVHDRRSTRFAGLHDDWTVVTADGKLAAHFEHTLAITADGPEILTA